MAEKEEVDLTETEKKIFEAIDKNDPVLLKALLTEKQNVNILDGNAMTPIQHAAYKGYKEIVQMLLDQGADVNLSEHQHNYTALHFAGLSGNIDVCLLLLLAGAKTNVTNTVGRTPAQMAGFVGHRGCAALMNNYVPKSEVNYYTTDRGKDGPLLPPFLAESFHKFIMEVNIHPVKIVFNIQNFAGLGDHLPEVKKVLESMREKEMKRGADINEVMAFKFHYLAYIVGEVNTIKQRQNNTKKEEADDEKRLDVTELFTRKLLKPGKDGNLDLMDAFLKECVREFPYRDCTLFRQMLTSLTGSDSPSALSIVISAINGQRGIDTVPKCDTCGEEKPAKKCSKCKVVQYCDRNCQRLHWHWHKKACSRLSQGIGLADNELKTSPDASELSAELQNLLVSN